MYSFNSEIIIDVTDFINISKVVSDIISKLICKGIKK